MQQAMAIVAVLKPMRNKDYRNIKNKVLKHLE